MPVIRPVPADPQRQALAARLQALFKLRGQSLTDPVTAEVYRVSLDSVRLILGSALGTGLITREQFDVIADMVDAAEDAPTLV